jgi:hypothetical protein
VPDCPPDQFAEAGIAWDPFGRAKLENFATLNTVMLLWRPQLRLHKPISFNEIFASSC